MSIHYRSLLRGEPGVHGGGVKKYYATIVLGEEVTIDEIVKEDVNETLIYDQSIRYLPGQKSSGKSSGSDDRFRKSGNTAISDLSLDSAVTLHDEKSYCRCTRTA